MAPERSNYYGSVYGCLHNPRHHTPSTLSTFGIDLTQSDDRFRRQRDYLYHTTCTPGAPEVMDEV